MFCSCFLLCNSRKTFGQNSEYVKKTANIFVLTQSPELCGAINNISDLLFA